MRRSRVLLVALSLVPGLLLAWPTSASRVVSNWSMYGHDASGNRDNSAERTLSVSSVHSLHVRWRSPLGPVYGTPAVVDDSVYAADVYGDVVSLDASTGKRHWLTHVGPVAAYPFFLTASPLVLGDEIVVGDQNGTVWALARRTGLLRWVRHPNTTLGFPAVWGAPSAATVRTAHGARTLLLVPFASNEETFTTSKRQKCCRARGSVAALDPRTGATVWQTYTISPAAHRAGAAGAGIWTTPVYDAAMNRIFVATGNNYANRENAPTTGTSDAVISLDAATGRIIWCNQRQPNDTWTSAYPLGGKHIDADFGDSPELFRLPNGRKVVSAGQKSGFLYVFDAQTGAVIGQRQFLPDGGLGGFFSDAAESAGVIYANGNDWTTYGGGETGGLANLVRAQAEGPAAAKEGDVIAIRPSATGALSELWRFRVPHSPMMGAVAVANGVVYVHASKAGVLYALDSRTGRPLAAVNVGPAINGPSIANGKVYLGYGDIANFAAENPVKGGVVALGF